MFNNPTGVTTTGSSNLFSNPTSGSTNLFNPTSGTTNTTSNIFNNPTSGTGNTEFFI